MKISLVNLEKNEYNFKMIDVLNFKTNLTSQSFKIKLVPFDRYLISTGNFDIIKFDYKL